MAWTPFSIHAARIAEFFPVHQLRTAETALAFLGSAWRTLSALNRIGISHGDPAFYNFLVGERTVLIDLDDCCYTGEAESPWDQSFFLHSTVVPMLGGFMSPKEIVSALSSLMPDASIVGCASAEALMPAVASSLEHIRTQRLLRSLAMRSRAVQIEVSETRTKLNARLTEEHRRYEDMLATAEERLRALQAAHTEMDQLSSIADQRARALQKVHDEAGDLRYQLERPGAFETVAAERLFALQEKDETLRRLSAELNAHLTLIDELDRRAKTFEAAAAERLVALHEKDESLLDITREAEARERGLRELTAVIQARDARVVELELVATERLTALEPTRQALLDITREAAELKQQATTFEVAAAERLVALQEKDETLRRLSTELDPGLTVIRELEQQAGQLAQSIGELKSRTVQLEFERDEAALKAEAQLNQLRAFEVEGWRDYFRRRYLRRRSRSG